MSALIADKSTATGSGGEVLKLRVGGMDCASCAHKIENALHRITGVGEVKVNVTGGSVSVTPSGEAPSAEAVSDAIRKLGFTVAAAGPDDHARADAKHDHEHGDNHDHDHGHSHGDAPGDRGRSWWMTAKGRLVLSAGGLLLLAMIADQLVPALKPWPYVAATLVALIPIAWRAIAAARAGSIFTIEMLMTIAAIGALAINAAEEAAVVVFLFSVGEVLEGVAASQARRGIAALTSLTPKTAQRITGGVVTEVQAEILKPGDQVLARPGDRIPCDGRIVEGVSDIDESPVNGESVPRTKKQGDEVHAGTVNLSAALTIEVTRAASDNTIARIIRLVEEAQESKAPIERFIDRFSRIYMPVVVGIAVLVAIVPPLAMGGSWDVWTYRALALLLIACPCALVISTPAAIAAGISAGARRGLLIKGGSVLETLGGLKTIAFDKTGTLTEGRPRVTNVESLGLPVEAVLRLAAGLEQGSSHPIAAAILAEATQRGVKPAVAAGMGAVAGRGITGEIDGEQVFLGSPVGASERSPLDEIAKSLAERLESEGKTVAVLIVGKAVAGMIAVQDNLREDARAGVDALRRLGVNSIMLTGDNQRTADLIAGQLDIEAHGALMPGDKARLVKEFQSAPGASVGVVGDGINDAPALAAARVGIAMGGGTDVALETADAALLKNQVSGVAELIALSRATMSNVRVNVLIALGSKGFFLGTTVLGMTGMWIAVLADTGATVLVTLNALRLLRFRFK